MEPSPGRVKNHSSCAIRETRTSQSAALLRTFKPFRLLINLKGSKSSKNLKGVFILPAGPHAFSCPVVFHGLYNASDDIYVLYA